MKYFLEHLWKCSGIVGSRPDLFMHICLILAATFSFHCLARLMGRPAWTKQKPKFLFNNLGVNNTYICMDSDFLCSQNDAALPSFTTDIN